MERYLGIILIITLTFFAKSLIQAPAVLGESTSSPAQALPASQPIHTESSFVTKLEDETQKLPREVVYQDNLDMEMGNEQVLTEGADGQKTSTFKITYAKDGEEYDRELVSVKITPAQDKKVLRGTKIVWRTLDTPDGQISYFRKLHVWTTSYTPFCATCTGTGRTVLGLQAGKGIIAVDPQVIKLGSKVYIPGYGQALAGDTGGAVKGNHIDLGFDEGTANGWYAHFIDIYLL